jgi:hypothetical protein
MKRVHLAILVGSMLAGSVMAGAAFAQAPAAPAAPPAPAHPIPGNVYCGGPPAANTVVAANDVSACEVNKVIAEAGEQLQMVRQRTLIFGQVPRPGIVGYGTVIPNWESNPNAAAIQNARYEYEPDFRIPAAREIIQPRDAAGKPTGTPTVHVVKVNRAWNEGPIPGANPMDVTTANEIAFRKARIWLTPHGVIQLAAFASKGLCPTARNSPATSPAKCADHKVSVEGTNIINVTGYGSTYKVTLDKDVRPARVETMVNGVALVATYADYRDGLGMGGQPSDLDIRKALDLGDPAAIMDRLAELSGPLDKYRVGLYYPEKVTITVGGKTVVDVKVTQGWSGTYSIFPDPELVRAASK